MKKYIILFSIVVCSNIINAQNDSIKAGWGNLDYSVPESPAFSLLGNNPDNILKPTSVRSIVLNIGNYYLTSGMTIPKNIAVEISPLLLNSKTSLNDYNKNKFLYRTRLSIGTNMLNKGGYEIAEGLRFTLIDKTDLRSDTEHIYALYDKCENISAILTKVKIEYSREHPEKYPTPVDVTIAYNKDKAFKKEIDDIVNSKIENSKDSINGFPQIKKQELWNAIIWEVGIAAMQNSTDSLINHSSFSKTGLWTTYGTHLSKNDQLLFGGKFGMVDSNSIRYGNVAIGTRYYYGSNELRGFIQGEYKYEKNMSNITASLGCVFNITNGIWGQFTMNFIFDNKGDIFYSPGFNISFGTPEKKKI
jgi:hypothetical protein